jgi:hypothetical protein
VNFAIGGTLNSTFSTRKSTWAHWRDLPYTDSPAPWRRLACAMLLSAALDAHAGRPDALEWVNSDTARQLAELVDLPTWPPDPDQLAGRAELRRRAAYTLGPEQQPLGALRVRSTNPADLPGRPSDW